jgi:predicted GNAT family acetyltransferase
MTLYGQYISEREDKHIVESSRGFLTYSFTNNAVYIQDLYVKPEFRKTGEAAKMADKVARLAIDKGYIKMIGSVVPSTKGSTSSMKVLLAYGFELDSSADNFIVFKKDLV